MKQNLVRNTLIVVLISSSLISCGGGGNSVTPTPVPIPIVVEPPPSNVNIPTVPVTPPIVIEPVTPPIVIEPVIPPIIQPPVIDTPVNPGMPSVYFTQQQAGRFLSRATFGAKISEIDLLTKTSASNWIDIQTTLPISSHQLNIENYAAKAKMAKPYHGLFNDSFYTIAAVGQDQLRQRVAFALSQIFVISFFDDTVLNNTRGAASYYDILSKNSFGNFRQLLEDVSLHPMMGHYLTSIRNQKADSTGRKPDENYAREIMQLFTIGLHQLNQDGSIKRDSSGRPLETYNNDDVMGLAKVFTGWSYYGPDTSNARFYGSVIDNEAMVKPLQLYSQYHSNEEKSFLGTTIPSSMDGRKSLSIALDTLFNHPNVGPFIGKQLIQRLVTSNPSPAYVSRVASTFNNNGQGVRGDMKSVIKAVLLDPEALNDATVTATNWGKVREPVLRLTNWLRTFNATSFTGQYTIGTTDDITYGLNQTPLHAPSVFNFYRPGYIAPNTQLAAKGMVAPEFQIVNEASSAGYANFMLHVLTYGVGTGTPKDVQSEYKNEIAIARNASDLVNYVNLLLTGATMTDSRKAKIINSVETIKVPDLINNADGTSNINTVNTALSNRVKLAIYMIMNTPEYIVQK